MNGIVTAVGKGTAVITVKAHENEEAAATCSYTVEDATTVLPPKGINLGCAVYDGPTSAGKPNGIGGVLTFKKSYTIDLKDGKGSTLNVESGDKIVDTKFDNGVLKLGELQRKSGERKYFSGVSEKF